uniref:Uncharacterized protein n=1 Tax=Romanomermis culicivorax TaxID=13658 RepID=A0A915IHH9_ROMCU
MADLAPRFRETFQNKDRDEEWKGAYETKEISDNTSALYFMMRGEAVATFKLAEEQGSGQPMDQEKPEEVIIADPPKVSTPPVRAEMELLLDQIKEMKQKIKRLEREGYREEAVELAKQIETVTHSVKPEKEPQDGDCGDWGPWGTL